MAKSLNGLGEIIRAQMAAWKVPGAGVAVVAGGEVIFAEGFGVRSIETQAPVTADSVFAIGSSTKAFVTFGLGLLVEEGKLDWDQPLRHYIPEFKMRDVMATERMTARDLVSHRSGLPRHDLAWYGSSRSRWELFEAIQYLEPSKDFRSYFQYQNFMFMAAGCLIERLSGMTWEAFTQERILKPLGMTSSNFSVNDSQAMGNIALPHEERDEVMQVVPFRNIDAVGPAGSINSNVVDMAQWMKVHLAKGEFNGARLIAEAQLAQMHRPQMVILDMPGLDLVLNQPEFGTMDYGLGWFIQRYRGQRWVHHGGSIDGFSAFVSLLPDADTGVVVLTNLGGSLAGMLLAVHVHDCVLDLPPIDWTARLKPGLDQLMGAAKEGEAKLREARHPDTQPSHTLEAYAGEYHHPGYGTCTTRLDDGRLRFAYNAFDVVLEHFHYDTFLGKPEGVPTSIPISFVTDMMGQVSQISAPLEGMAAPILFQRRAGESGA